MIKFSELNTAKSCEGLVPAISQDDDTRQVLMLGYLNEEAFDKTVAEGRVTFFSRTKGRLWTKGETSGNYLHVKSIAKDCDADTLLIRVVPAGPVCHTGSKTCFGGRENEGFIGLLQSVIRQRHRDMPEGSYTTKSGQNRAKGGRGSRRDRHRGRCEQQSRSGLRGIGPDLPPARAARESGSVDRRSGGGTGQKAQIGTQNADILLPLGPYSNHSANNERHGR